MTAFVAGARRHRDGIVLGLLALLFVAWIVAARMKLATYRPATDVATFETYLAEMPTPEFLHVFREDEAEVLVAYGSTALWMLASGPPAYAFDRQGELQGWTSDVGDDPEFMAQWTTGKARLVTVHEAREWIGKHPLDGAK